MATPKSKMRLIRNGKAYPENVKAATVAEVRSNPTKTFATIAVERNIAECTVRTWAAAYGVTRPSKQHPNTASAVKAHWAAYKAMKAFNTPTVQYHDVARTRVAGIQYQGKLYV